MSELSVEAKTMALGDLLSRCKKAGGCMLSTPPHPHKVASKGMGYIFWMPDPGAAEAIAGDAQACLDRAYRALLLGRPSPGKVKARMDAKVVEGSDFTLGTYTARQVWKDSRDGLVATLESQREAGTISAMCYIASVVPTVHLEELPRAAEMLQEIESGFAEAIEYVDAQGADAAWHCRRISGEARRLSYYSRAERRRRRTNVGDLVIAVCGERPEIRPPKPRAESPLRIRYAREYLGIEFEPLGRRIDI